MRPGPFRKPETAHSIHLMCESLRPKTIIKTLIPAKADDEPSVRVVAATSDWFSGASDPSLECREDLKTVSLSVLRGNLLILNERLGENRNFFPF